MRSSRAYSSSKSNETVFCVPKGLSCYPRHGAPFNVPSVFYILRMHCKIVFNFALRHRLAFSSSQTRKALMGLSNLDPVGQWAESNCFCETQSHVKFTTFNKKVYYINLSLSALIKVCKDCLFFLAEDRHHGHRL